MENNHIFPISFLDIETTGMSPVKDKIIEIAVIRVNEDMTEKIFYSFVNPEIQIPPDIQKITGIKEEYLKDAPKFKEIGLNLLEFIKNSTLIAHNAIFDLAFLQESLKRESLQTWNGKTIDSVKFFKKVIPKLPSYSLSFLKDYFKISQKNDISHRALNDAKTLKELFFIISKIK